MKRTNTMLRFLRGLISFSIILAAIALIPGIRTASAGNCMQDLVTFGLNCTANDVRIAVYNKVGGPPVCFPGEYITVELQADLVAGASERYDVGLFTALDGGNALTGTCWQDWLNPPLSSTSTPVGEQRTTPFYNAEASADPADMCGDLEQGAHNLKDLPALTFKCQDRNSDGFADIDTCTSWENSISDGSKSKPSCTNVNQTLPSTPSKCRCEAVKIAGVVIGGKIIVQKYTDPSGDSASFNFNLTGGPDNVNVSFGLTDAASFTSDALKPGTYSVTESVPDGWDLASSTCDNGSSPSAISLESNQTITCTFNNEKKVTENPELTVKKSSTTAAVTAAGQVVPYSYLVKNTGNVTVTGIGVTDDKVTSVSCPSASLDAGADMTCTGSHMVTQAEMDAGGSLSNKVTVTSANAPTVTETLDIPITQNPHMMLSKISSLSSYSKVGDVINYTLAATNDGNVTLSNVSITDSKIGTLSCAPAQPATLAPSEKMTCTGSYTVKQSDLDAGKVDNTANASGANPGGGTTGGGPASVSVPAVQNPHLSLAKSAAPTSYSKVGDIISYTLVAKNDGNVTLSNVSISDPKLGPLSCSPAQPATLFPNSTLTCTGSYTVNQADLDAGSVSNTSTASGVGPQGQPATATGSAAVPAVQSPHLTLTKTADPATFSNVGDTINYELVATNDGNVTLHNVSISDPKLGPLSCSPSQPATLAPNSTLTCTANYTTTQADIPKIANTATVSGKSPQDQPVSATASATVNIYPEGAMTDTMLCSLPGDQFKLVFTPDQNAQGSWKLNASNPGQYYYNYFYIGTGNEDITITLPYPWVTQGAVAIHFYSDVSFSMNSGGYCLTPGSELANQTDQITLANYSPKIFGSTTTVTFHVPPLSGGFAYINIHLDYGLKGTTGYAKGGPSGNDAVKSGTSTVLIPDKQSYSFSEAGGDIASITSINSFKKDPGIGGLVLNANGDPAKNAKVQIFQGTSKTPAATVYTDEDGWYMWQYKWTGKAVSFAIKMTPPLPYKQTTQSQTVTLKANGYLVVNFTVSLQ